MILVLRIWMSHYYRILVYFAHYMLRTDFYFISNICLIYLGSLIILTLVLLSIAVSLVVQRKSIISLITYTCAARDKRLQIIFKACEHDVLLRRTDHFIFNLFVHRLNVYDE